MPRIRSITAAVNTSVRIGALNVKRKPRHIDNGLLALSWLYRRIGNHGKALWVTVEHLQDILKEVYYKDPKRFLGPYFSRSFRRVIPELVEQGYIRWNTNKTKFRVSKQMAILCMQAASQTPGEEEVDRHHAHADYFRQKISMTRPTYAMVVEENKELREKLKGRFRDTNLSDIVREASVVTFASDGIFDADDEPAGQVEEVGAVPASGLSCYASGSTIISTPIKLTRATGPNYSYPTPQSLPHAYTAARPPSSSPSLGRTSFSSRGNPIVDMEVDEMPIVAGPSGSASSIPFDGSVSPSSVSNHDADIVYLAKVVNAPTSTVQSIEVAYYTQISELKKECRETREKILELTSAFDKEQGEWKEEHSKLVKQLEQQKDELTVCQMLLDQSRENERLNAALSEEKNRFIQALSEVGTVNYQDEESHKNLRAKMLEELRLARYE